MIEDEACTYLKMGQDRGCSPREAQVGFRLSKSGLHNRKQISSFVLFISAIVILNLCPPFQKDFEQSSDQANQKTIIQSILDNKSSSLIPEAREEIQLTFDSLARNVEGCLRFAKLMFTNPMRLGKRTNTFSLAEARVLGKMAKVWYIKKKIKKLSKKLKKHTIAVPVITAIPIYEHSY